MTRTQTNSFDRTARGMGGRRRRNRERLVISRCIHGLRIKQPGRMGLTLVELLAALTLATLLFAGVLGVLTLITRGQRVLLSRTSWPEPGADALAALLAWDLENSRTLEVTETGFRLAGYAGRDFETQVPLHCVSLIEYEVVELQRRHHLIRRETHPEVLSLDNTVTELVCPDVSQIVLGSPEWSGQPPAEPESIVSLDSGLLPQQVSVLLRADGTGRCRFFRNLTR